MANTFYTLFGQEFVGAQNSMMAHVFSELLNRHPDLLPLALRKLTCLDTIDYARDLEALRTASSKFSNPRTFPVGEQMVCLATAYGLGQKHSHISKLFRLCGEDEAQFDVLEENELHGQPKPVPKEFCGESQPHEGISYRLFGTLYRSNQAAMIYHVFQEVLNRFPELTDWAAKNLKCASWTDYTLQKNRGSDMPKYFNHCRMILVGKEQLCVGSTLDFKTKMDCIDRLTEKAGLPKTVFHPLTSEASSVSQTWAEQAVYGITDRLRELSGTAGSVGLVTIPPGASKLPLLEELARRLAKDGWHSLQVLLLANTTSLASEYARELKRALRGSHTVRLIESFFELDSQDGSQEDFIISSVDRLPIWDRQLGLHQNLQTFGFISQPRLVIIEEAAHHNLKHICSFIRIHFSNAALLGLTIDSTPSDQPLKELGPVIYSYPCMQALRNGAVKKGFYQQVWGNPDDLPHGDRQIADWIAAQEKGRKNSAILLCRDLNAALSLFTQLQFLLGPERIRIHAPWLRGTDAEAAKWYRQASKGFQWKGKRFPGMLIVCAAFIYDLPVDTVYLIKRTDRFTTLSILSALTMHRKMGRLMDFYDHRKWLKEEELALLNEEPPVSLFEPSDQLLGELRQQLTDALSGHEYDQIEGILAQISAASSETGERIASQLEFLFPANVEPARRSEYWTQHENLLAWKSDLWCTVSQDSLCVWKEPDRSDPAEERAAAADQEREPEPDPRPLPAVHADETQQQRGARLELATKELLRSLFELSDDLTLDELHSQLGGTQYGFDITFTYRDCRNTQVTCHVECKNLQDSPLTAGRISQKLSDVQDEGMLVDHWIAISPNGTVTPALNNKHKKWLLNDKWYPVLDIQFWTKDNQVDKLFELFPDLYRQFYASEPPERTEEERCTTLKEWKERLAPVPHLPRAWREYLRKPEWMLTYVESDSDSLEDYRKSYPNRVPSRLLDAGGQLIDGPAEAYISKWLERDDSFYALLWGDFGDGKSFFTYVLARYVAEQFLRSPNAGWIPLRFSLRTLSGNDKDERQFLEDRLKEFSADLASWKQITIGAKYKFFIILDGLDEMSLDMSENAVLQNLVRLEHLLRQFNGCKILVTSRKMDSHTDSVRDRVLKTLHQPLILHMAPVSLEDRLAFLERLANTSARRARLEKIRTTHDLIGLAAKPLFLNMIRAQLDNEDICEMDVTDIYQDYAERALGHDHEYHLELEGDFTSSDEVCAHMCFMLEQMALCMQELGTDSISLDMFKRKIGQDNLAQALWDSVGQSSGRTAEDADHRVASRSLLKRDNTDPKKRCFFHRSMKEFFVACGIVRALCQANKDKDGNENKDEARTVLSRCRLGHEILEFAGQKLRHLEEKQRTLIGDLLAEFAHEIRMEYSIRPTFLSENSVSLLHYGGFGLPGTDWSGLCLDEVMLSGEDLSYKNFSRSSMRFAHLDNADLTECDLRGCDFTGVQFEKSGQLASFAVCPSEDAILACYRDGTIRRWQISNGQSRIFAGLDQLGTSPGRILLGRGEREGLSLSERFQFWQRSADRIELAGHAVLRRGVKILGLGEAVVLIRQGSELYLVLLSDKSILYQCEMPDEAKACLMTDRILVLQTADAKLELVDLSGEGPVFSAHFYGKRASNLYAYAISDTEGIVLAGTEQGEVNRFHVSYDHTNERWDFSPEGEIFGCEKPAVNIAADAAGRPYAASPSGAINRYVSGAEHLEQDAAYQLELKCSGALIEGVQPQEQYQILRDAGHTRHF